MYFLVFFFFTVIAYYKMNVFSMNAPHT